MMNNTGRRLGRGAMGDVHEVTIKGVKLAHKTMIFRRKITERNKREIEILKRLSHVHMVQLIGTYTKQRVVGILLYPVAICDLHTFFEDVEAWTSTMSENTFEGVTQDNRLAGLESEHKQRLEALNYQFPLAASNSSAIPIYSKIGCLISAIAYLHEEKVRHQDLKPSNILLGPDRVWLSDFGSATDFTLLSQSATDNERGTPRYFSPEMAEFKATGRASDIFSLGCVVLEITVLHATGSLSHIRSNRSADASFHANLDRISTWQTWSDKALPPWEYLLHWEIKKMLSKDPEQRPTAQNLLANIRSTETMRRDNSEHLLFGQCCKYEMMSLQEHEQRMFKSKSDLQALREHLAVRTKASLQLTTENGKLHDQIKNLSISMRMLEAKKQKIEIEIGNIKLENGHLSHKKRELEKMIVVFEDRVSSMAGDLERSEVETRELYLMLRQSDEKEEDEDSRRRLYANLTGQLQTKHSDPILMQMDAPSPPSKDIKNPLVRTSDPDERDRPRRSPGFKVVSSSTTGSKSGVRVEYVPSRRQPSLEK
ncbi:kinase-like protein [Pyrenochaeta sp. DS3sAY3a]|nr:kinase-like protein [Pyrenochaeta sp. DS3sAY3a]